MLSRIFPQLNIGAGDSGVVYQDVDGRDDSKGLANGTHHGTEIADVRDKSEAAKLLSGGLGCRVINVPNHDVRTRQGKAFGNRETQPRRTTRHDGVTAVEI